MYPYENYNNTNYFTEVIKMAYIIDSYNKHSEWDRSHTVETFYLNGV